MSDQIPDKNSKTPDENSKNSDKNSRKNVIQFALMLSLICSLLITAAASGLKKFQQENVALDKKINILKAANLLDGKKKPPKSEISRLYDIHIREVIVDNSGKTIDTDTSGSMRLYFYQTGDTIKSSEDNVNGFGDNVNGFGDNVNEFGDNVNGFGDNTNKFRDNINGYIIPINTRGLWGKIQGYLAFENDGQTVSGFSVFSHSETPGLGGEIESAWFRKNFKGKKILNSKNKFVSLGIARGKVKNMSKELQEHYVDGISGATLTGKYLSQGLEATLIKYEPVSIFFRQKKLSAVVVDIHKAEE